LTKRTKLIATREEHGLEQQDVANGIGCSRETVSLWELGKSDPQDHWIDKLCTFFEKEDPADLDLARRANTEKRVSEIAKMQRKLGHLNLDRREALELIGSLSVFAGIDLTQLLKLLETPNIIVPEEFLDACHAAINACWHLLKHDGLGYVDEILKACLPTLSQMTAIPSDHQRLAASLAMQAKTLEGLLAMHRLDYMSFEIHIGSAVRFGSLSGNERLRVAALNHQGNIYNYHLPDTERAKRIYKKGFTHLDGNDFLNTARLSITLASVYAQEGDKDQAIEMIKQARAAMPKHPERDPLSYLIDFGLADLDRAEGRVYQYLAEKLQSEDYAEKAYKAFVQGTELPATSSRSRSQTLIHLADAALVLDDFAKFTESLEHGWTLGVQIDSLVRQHEARTVLEKARKKWGEEQKYQDLEEMF
jgi:DNA-binding XRE family transcriptional regulator